MTRLSARFEDFDGHRSVVVSWLAEDARAQALWVPAFGDEMNQTRRMVRLAAQALAARGVDSHVFDLFGTGDSSAGFEQASLDRWLADCLAMAARIEARRPGQPLILIGCRLGVALAARLSHALPRPVALLIGWAPVMAGRLQLGGMLRAARMARMQRPDEAGQADPKLDPKAEWAEGRTVWLAGYPIAAELAAGLDALDATLLPAAEAVALFDVRMALGDGMVTVAEPLAKRAEAWTQAGVPCAVTAVAGPAFWNVADLVDVPELVTGTVAAVESRGLA